MDKNMGVVMITAQTPTRLTLMMNLFLRVNFLLVFPFVDLRILRKRKRFSMGFGVTFLATGFTYLVEMMMKWLM